MFTSVNIIANTFLNSFSRDELPGRNVRLSSSRAEVSFTEQSRASYIIT